MTQPNRLIHAQSPYLIQHAYNPVDWYPWEEEAFQRAKEEEKLIFLSIGYATCHWCHVMARESFSDESVAALLNEHFISIKVDREERPDVDQIYMDALLLSGQQGGWPLSMFLTPYGEPIVGGTYFPPVPIYQMPSFKQILTHLIELWDDDRFQIEKQAQSIAQAIQTLHRPEFQKTADSSWYHHAIRTTLKKYSEAFDSQAGGFTFQPKNKFPPNLGCAVLLREFVLSGDATLLDMVVKTLYEMKQGGIYDQLGGGLCRYATDYQWQVPHFEKMLYDNALFTQTLLETYQVTRDSFFLEAALDVLGYIDSDLAAPDGGFYTAEDADSEGTEGKYYVWNRDQLQSCLSQEDVELACTYWGITESGNFEGNTILSIQQSPEQLAAQFQLSLSALQKRLKHIRMKLLEVRKQRIRPFRDEKILAAWNALLISAYTCAGRVNQNSSWIEKAERAAQFIRFQMHNSEGRLLRSQYKGKGTIPAFLEDLALVGNAWLDLFEVTGDIKWVDWVMDVVKQLHTYHREEQDGFAYYTNTANDCCAFLITRTTIDQDGVIPSGMSALVRLYIRLAIYGHRFPFLEEAEQIFDLFQERLMQGYGMEAMVTNLQLYQTRLRYMVIHYTKNSSRWKQLQSELQQHFTPWITILFVPNDQLEAYQKRLPILKDKTHHDDHEISGYLCDIHGCHQVMHTPEEVKAAVLDNSYIQALRAES
jgi:uncharacterized protein